MPHSLALVESLDMICVADRENMRIACPRAGLREVDLVTRSAPAYTIHQPDLGRVFAVASYGKIYLLIHLNVFVDSQKKSDLVYRLFPYILLLAKISFFYLDHRFILFL